LAIDGQGKQCGVAIWIDDITMETTSVVRTKGWGWGWWWGGLDRRPACLYSIEGREGECYCIAVVVVVVVVVVGG